MSCITTGHCLRYNNMIIKNTVLGNIGSSECFDFNIPKI